MMVVVMVVVVVVMVVVVVAVAMAAVVLVVVFGKAVGRSDSAWIGCCSSMNGSGDVSALAVVEVGGVVVGQVGAVLGQNDLIWSAC